MDDAWYELVAAARTEMVERQMVTFAEFGLNFSMQYEWNLERADIVFSRGGVPTVRANLLFLASAVNPDGTWLWGWANDTIPAVATTRPVEIRRYGEAEGFAKLTESEWQPRLADCSDVMAIAAYLLDAPAFFLDRTQNLAMYFVLDGFERVDGTTV
jgi:hypothetical protein